MRFHSIKYIHFHYTHICWWFLIENRCTLAASSLPTSSLRLKLHIICKLSHLSSLSSSSSSSFTQFHQRPTNNLSLTLSCFVFIITHLCLVTHSFMWCAPMFILWYDEFLLFFKERDGSRELTEGGAGSWWSFDGD